jgi:hypothetical protein
MSRPPAFFFPIASFTQTYLGLPLSIFHVIYLAQIISKCNKYLARWHGNFTTISGRLILVDSVLPELFSHAKECQDPPYGYGYYRCHT